MQWMEVYGAEQQPLPQQIEQYIGSPLWRDLAAWLEENYAIQPAYSYSGCSGQPGWNVKYQKSGRSLCTLYPDSGFFIALVVIGVKQQAETEALLPLCSEYTQQLYAATPFSAGGRWLMLRVTGPQVLADVKKLVQVRRKISSRQNV